MTPDALRNTPDFWDYSGAGSVASISPAATVDASIAFNYIPDAAPTVTAPLTSGPAGSLTWNNLITEYDTTADANVVFDKNEW